MKPTRRQLFVLTAGGAVTAVLPAPVVAPLQPDMIFLRGDRDPRGTPGGRAEHVMELLEAGIITPARAERMLDDLPTYLGPWASC